jgi:hypothetical protein
MKKILFIIIATIILIASFSAKNFFAKKIGEIQATDVVTGLIRRWTMDIVDISGTTYLDKSGNGKHMTMTGGAPSIAGALKEAALFNGTSQYLANSDTTTFASTSTFSLSVWYKGTDTAQNGNYGKGLMADSGSQWTCAGFVLRSGYASYFHYVPGWLNLTSTSFVADNNWHHLAFINNNNTGIIYVDGKAETTGDSTITTGGGCGNKGYRISGIARNYPGVNTSGAIDDARMYNIALSANQVKQIYNTGLNKTIVNSPAKTASSTAGSLIAWWPLDQTDIRYAGTATTTYDRSGFNNTGAFSIGANTYGATSTQGKIKQAIDFDGVDDQIIFPAINLGTTHTVSVWSKGNTLGSGLIGQGASEYALYYNAAGINYCASCASVTSWAYTLDNAWHNIIISRDGANATLYIDGISQTAKAIDNNVLTLDEIGSSGNSLFWKGGIDDVRFYNRVLSAAEAAQIYNGGKIFYAQ